MTRSRIVLRIVLSLGALAIVAVVGLAVVNASRQGEPNVDGEETRRDVNVVVAPAQVMEFQRVIAVQGNVQAKRYAMVSPRINGVLDEVFVDEGDSVVAGETHLFQSDALKLQKTLEVRGDEVAVAESSLREKEASRDKSQADFDNAESDWRRYHEMFERGVSSTDELEDADAAYKGAVAMLKHAAALVDLAAAQLKQARSSLAMAQKDLDDSLVLAPLSGRVTERFREPGEMGNPGQPVLRIEDPSLVEVSVFLPAQAYGEVIPGQTEMQVTVNGLDLGQRSVSYKSPTINTQLRTFEARCLIQDPPSAVASGAMAHARVVLERREGLGVPRDAIQNRAGGTVVFVVDGDKARMVSVTVGLETNGIVEVASEHLDPAAQVVAVGGYFLDPDAAIKVVQESP